MRKILLVTETTSTINFDEAKELGIEMLPLSIIFHQKEYKDHLDITTEELCKILKEGGVPSTSQPNIGLVEESMKKWKEQHWDAIIIVTLSSTLSGTFQGFYMMKEQLKMDNVYIVDSHTVAGPVRDAIQCACAMIKEGKNEHDILKMMDRKFKNTFSMLYPHTLEQLKKGGRISPLTANALSLMKIKPLIYLNTKTYLIEKYGIARTETRIIDMIVKEFKKQNIQKNTHSFYISHILVEQVLLNKLENALKKNFDNIEVNYVELPAVLTCHGGLGCFAIQSILK